MGDAIPRIQERIDIRQGKTRQRTLRLSVRRFSPYFLITGLPMFLWQAIFFFGALVLLFAMTFWTVENYRLTPDFSLKNWEQIFSTNLFLRIYLRTIFFVSLSAALATVLAIPFAYAVAFRVSTPVRRVLFLFLLTPYFTSYLVRSYSLRFMIEADGPVNWALELMGFPAIGFQGSAISLILGYLGLIFPLVCLIVLVSFIQIDRAYIEASYNLGGGRFRTVFSTVLPLARGGLVLAFVFGFLFAFGDYVAPSYVAAGAYPTLGTLIINTIQGSINFPYAAVISVIMMFTLLLVVFGAFWLGESRRRMD